MKIADMEVSLIGSFGSDLTVVNAARVSMHKESQFKKDTLETWPDDPEYWELEEKDEKLIKYLAEHQHTSPFNHAFISMRIKAPIFVARQLVKHKFMPWNEVSRRYVDEEPEFYFPKYWRAKADNVKQGSSDIALEMLYPDYDLGMWIESQTNEQLNLYKQCLTVGMCPEQARMILPLNTMTEWIWSGTLGAWCEMLVLRLGSHTQKETREVAVKAYNIIKKLFPISVKYRVGDINEDHG